MAAAPKVHGDDVPWGASDGALALALLLCWRGWRCRWMWAVIAVTVPASLWWPMCPGAWGRHAACNEPFTITDPV